MKEVVGDYPVVYCWDLGGIETKSNKNIDGIPFDKMRQYIIDGYNRGGVITISWHYNNPLASRNAWDTTQNHWHRPYLGHKPQKIYVLV